MSFIGPALPPHLQRSSSDDQGDQSDDDTYGPALPPHLKAVKQKESSSDDDESYGPSLPPHLQQQPQKNINPLAGPSSKLSNDSEPSSDDEVVGPMPSDAGVMNIELERRALQMKRKLAEGGDELPEKAQREDWMIELPELHSKNFGLGPRTFSNTKGPEITGRDQWTTVEGKEPAEEKKKDKKKQHLEYYEQQKNEKLEKIVKEYNSAKRPESLLKAHQKELKRKQKEEQANKSTERRPFNRDEDMKLNKLDSARKKELIKRSGELNFKFKSGASKFL